MLLIGGYFASPLPPPAARLPLAFVWSFFEISQPNWLWLALLILPIIYIWRTSRVPASVFRRWTSLFLRTTLVLAVVLALAGTRIIWKNHGICVAFLMDQSQSVTQGLGSEVRDALRTRIQDEVNKMSKDDQFVVIEFGGDAVLSSLPSFKGPLPPVTEVDDTGHTDISRALRLAMSAFPTDRQKRIVLFTDANQNVGDAQRQARILAANDIDINVIPLRAHGTHEVMVDQFTLPTRVQKGAALQGRAIINSDQAQGATLRLSRDGQPLPPRQVQLKEGTNVFDLTDTLDEGGVHQYSLTIEPDGGADADTFAANNTAEAFTQVDAPGKVLVIRGKPDQRDYIAEALQENRIETETHGPDFLPIDPKSLSFYDCIVLENVGATQLSDHQMENLETWVKDFGGGLILIGGNDSFGPGGYKGTAIERISPVEMDVKRKKHLASIAMVIVMDKSGSMGAPVNGGPNLTKMDLANQGAVETLKLLSPSDEAQIGAVDTEVKWMSNTAELLPMTDGNRSRLTANTLSNKAGGGGIYTKTALYHAYQLITSSHVNANARHVILFADCADTEQQEDCLDLARQYHHMDPPVTTTVIGLGQDADPDVPFQKQLASIGGGRWYGTSDAMALPRIFAKEAFIAARNAFVEKKEGIPLTLYDSPLLQSFRKTGVPRVYGYVGTTLKPRATLAAYGLEQDDPVIAHWSIGLGKCVAFTSDATGRWGKDWVRWEDFNKFWAQSVRWASKSVLNSPLLTTTTIEGNEGRIHVEAADTDGKPINNLQLGGNIAPPDSESRPIHSQFVQVAPGQYEAKFPVNDRGTYMVTVVDKTANVALDTSGATMSYPPEFRDLTPNMALAKTLAETTSGLVLDAPTNLFQEKPQPVRTYWLLSERLLLISSIALLLDIAWRRLNVADWFHRAPAVAFTTASGSALGALRNIRTGRQEVQQQTKTMRERSLIKNIPDAPADPQPSPALNATTQNQPAAANAESQTDGYVNRLLHAKRRAAQQMREQQEKED